MVGIGGLSSLCLLSERVPKFFFKLRFIIVLHHQLLRNPKKKRRKEGEDQRALESELIRKRKLM